MNNLNQLEIQNIRHLAGSLSGICAKITYYKTLTSDTNISDQYDDICAASSSFKNKLTGLFEEV